jgi:O-acetyl-ADP-ribose deacetylase (regulator of RNase III)
MITFRQGNMLQAPVEALVNTVNTVGVMGKGIALMFKEAFPDNFRAYEEACKRKEVRIGTCSSPRTCSGRSPLADQLSQQEALAPAVEAGMDRGGAAGSSACDRGEEDRSIALPPLGCGNGGLDWSEVRPEIERALRPLESVEVVVFEPTEKYQNVAKPTGVRN